LVERIGQGDASRSGPLKLVKASNTEHVHMQTPWVASLDSAAGKCAELGSQSGIGSELLGP
jgi:hypothetical protein